MRDTYAERRIYTRMPVEIPAILQGGIVKESCKVLDFGQGGARVACSDKLDISDSVDLEISGLGQFHGTIAWRKTDSFGVSFCAPGSTNQNADKSSLIGIDPF